MGSLVLQSSPPADMALAADPTGPTPPELNDAGYLRDVLCLGVSRSEGDLDRDLMARAADLGVELSASRPSTAGKLNTSAAESEVTVVTNHARSASAESHGSASTGMTSQHSLSRPTTSQDSPGSLLAKKRIKSLSFSQYERYISQVDPNLTQPKFLSPPPSRHERSASLFSVTTRTGYTSIKRGLSNKLKWRKRPLASSEPTISCICCREEFSRTHALQTLPCGHTYCESCLAIMTKQATTDESKMPPRCCTQPIPGSVVKAILSREEQHVFLKAVLQYSTPWESRIFCPGASCGEFIPPRTKIDPKHPFEVVCRHCKARVCVMCKRNAHRLGQDCPDDWELDAVLKMGEKSGWRRCYKCRTLVELTQGCTHMTCRCKAQFCYICGAVWDPVVGCPNFCNGEEELERRRMEEEARMAELQAEKEAQEAAAAAEEAERLQAEKRTAECAEFHSLREEQERELQRFRVFERKMRWTMWARHSQKKLALVEKFSDLIEKMRERHSKTEQHLEDRQIEAEMDLRTSLEQSERSIKIRLKHMEAYCNGLGRQPDSGMPEREVTQRHLDELGQQYHVRDGIERRHQSQINVLREKQAKKMEELMERHAKELEGLNDKREEEIEDLAIKFTNEEEALAHVFEDRKAKLQRRWELAIGILQKELEKQSGLRYGPMGLPEWPAEAESSDDECLTTVDEELPTV